MKTLYVVTVTSEKTKTKLWVKKVGNHKTKTDMLYLAYVTTDLSEANELASLYKFGKVEEIN